MQSNSVIHLKTLIAHRACAKNYCAILEKKGKVERHIRIQNKYSDPAI